MSPRAFDCYMVQVGVGTNRKLRRLPAAQRWAYVAGVLSLAAQSPMRGSLLIHDGERVTEHDVAAEATITVKDARSALHAFRRMGMLERDEHGVEWVHDWDDFNPDPKPSDSAEARRERKRRERAKKGNGHANVTRDNGVTSRESHAPKVAMSRREVEGEVEEKTPPYPPSGGRRRDREFYEQELLAYATALLPGVPAEVACRLVATAAKWANPQSGREVLAWLDEHREVWPQPPLRSVA